MIEITTPRGPFKVCGLVEFIKGVDKTTTNERSGGSPV